MPKIASKRGKIENHLSYPWREHILAQRILGVLFDHRILSTKAIRYELSSTGHQPTRVNIALTRLNQLGYLTEHVMLTNKEYKCDFCHKSSQYFGEKKSIDAGLSILEENKRKHDLDKKKKDHNPSNWFDCKKGFILKRFVSLICTSCHKIQKPDWDDETKVSKGNQQYKIQQNYRYWSLSNKGNYAVVAILGYESFSNLSMWQEKDNIFTMVKFLMQCDRKEVVGWLINRIRNTLEISPDVADTVNKWYAEARETILNLDAKSLSITGLSDFKAELARELETSIITNARKK